MHIVWKPGLLINCYNLAALSQNICVQVYPLCIQPLVMKQYFDILQYLAVTAIQYNTIWLKNIFAIYYNVCCLNVVNIQSLHCKNDQTSA